MTLVPQKRGRPSLPWELKSEKSKREDVAAFCEELKMMPREKVMRSVCKMLKETGEKDLAAIIKDSCAADINQKAELRKKFKKEDKTIIPLSGEAGLGLLLDCRLTKHQYIHIRNKVNSCGQKVLPCYDVVYNSKQLCRPSPNSISVSETVACVQLSALLHHTVSRIAMLAKEFIIENQARAGINEEICVFNCSYGFDGSTGQSNYKQGYQDLGMSPTNDSSLFVSTLIPLTLASGNVNYWINRTPQSIRFCRPIRIQFTKETKEVILAEQNYLESQILNLHDFTINISENHKLIVKFNLLLTVIDGKVLSVLTGVPSSQSCPICGSTPNQFNDLNNINSDVFQPKDGALLHGISPLHSWIRFFEFLLHVSYRLKFKSWQIRAGYKQQAAERKQMLQEKFWLELSLRIDYPSPGGSGTSNDGNTARRAFGNPQKLANILEIDYEYILGIRAILIAFGSQLPINPSSFELHCRNLMEKHIELYNWFKLPASVHKVFVHGADIIRACALPVGLLGEEGAESRNKLYRQDRERHSRKMNRQVTLFDMFHRAMDSSDPVLSSISLDLRNDLRKRQPLPSDVIKLLAIPDDFVPIMDLHSVDVVLDSAFEDNLIITTLENEIPFN